MKFTEESLEKAVIELFREVDIPHVHGQDIHRVPEDILFHEDLRQYLGTRYAPEDVSDSEISSIIRKLESLPSSSLYESNRQFMELVSNGFNLVREDRAKKDFHVELIDKSKIESNLFKIVNQLEIKGLEKRIPDAIVYINGIPLVVIEFKSAIKENTTILDAHTQLTVRYRRDIPNLLKYNAFCVISDGVNNKMGSLFSPYEFYYAWRKVHNSDEPSDGINSLFTMVRGLFDKARLVDVISNFIYFPDSAKDNEKYVCRYPQYYAAKKLYENITKNLKPLGSGKGGTYFGATGSGKSIAMLYLTRLLMKSKELQSPTILLITDRNDLDDQLSAQFTSAKEFIGDQNVLTIQSREDLKAKLSQIRSGGVYLTTIQKFTESTELLTDRTNVICISDEAHRTQINLDQTLKISAKGVEKKFGFAKYLHDSLPNATYVGVTGTPIDGTLEVFGEVVDAYTMQESVEDEITVRIVYEGRAAKVLLDEAKLEEIEDYYDKCFEEGANEYQIEESKKATARMDVILGNKDRLKLLAKDFVAHYEARVSEGATVFGKVMFVCSSRPIAYDFYKEVITLKPEWAEPLLASPGVEVSETEQRLLAPSPMIRMVMTRNQDDTKDLYDLLGTKDDRKELDRQFKIAKSNFKIAIVVDMWLTGFDVPFLEAIYIDKPIQQHSLIQTISRVNRVYEGKEVGLVVDYIGIKGKMNTALKKYSKVHPGDFVDTEKAVAILRDCLDLLRMLFHKFDDSKYFSGTPLEKLLCLNNAAEFVQMTEEIETRFMSTVIRLRSAYNLSISSNSLTQHERDYVHLYIAIRSIIFKLSKGEAPDTAKMNATVIRMIEDALISDGVEEIFRIDENSSDMAIDIFDDAYLEKIDKIKLPNTKIKLLQRLLSQAIAEYKKTNLIKGVDFSKKLKNLVDLYNERKDFEISKSDVLEDLAGRFTALFHELQDERSSFTALGIDFEEKAFYDILKSVAEKYKFEYPEEKLIVLAQEVKLIVDDKAKYTDWSKKADIKAELKVDLILTLDKLGYPPVPKDEVFQEIFEQAENFKRYTA
ncbi:MAG: HsdR family type I site-specific deoxyribonuclease [Actinobacteria bacterium]|uniref:type I site-specific deoxyribonuclease n=1 Tax=freshwater metagenome TaxID=449393 RepID=A0A6J6MJD0_9ZZZZ|nr:HsdR family type I site-specific deoxyribonuclease [Actinomycetota bacterium]